MAQSIGDHAAPRGGDWLEDEITSWRHVGIDTIVSALMKEESTEELRTFLNNRFHIAARVRNIRDGLGYRVYQVQKPKNRHLIDVRPVESLPPCQRVEEVLVVTPPELIAGKVMAWRGRQGKPKAGSDWRDLAMLLLMFPELKTAEGPVTERLHAAGASAEVMAAWKELLAQEILPEDDADEFGG